MAEASADSLRLRTLSATALLPVPLAAAYVGGWVFAVLILVAALLAGREWDRLCRGSGGGAVALSHAAIVTGAIVLAARGEYSLALGLAAAGAVAVGAIAALAHRMPGWPATGVAYIALPAIACIYLRGDPEYGRTLVLWMFLAVWAADVGGFVAGRTFGGPRLAPRISPGKTWAGLGGGLVSAMLVGAAAALVADPSSIALLVLVSAVVALVAQCGDLAESWVKRRFDAKNSGSLIPGHGGLLDRLDSMIFAAPAVAGVVLLGAGDMLAWR